MSKKMAGFIITSGILLTILTFMAGRLRGQASDVTFLAGLLGGGLTAVLGFAALLGYKRRVWLGVVLAVTTFVLLAQVVHVWASPAILAARLLDTFMLVQAIATLMYLMHGDRTEEFYQTRAVGHSGVKGTPRG